MAAPLLARSSLLHPAAPPLGSLTAAGAPLIDAEDLFRQTGPAHLPDGVTAGRVKGRPRACRVRLVVRLALHRSSRCSSMPGRLLRLDVQTVMWRLRVSRSRYVWGENSAHCPRERRPVEAAKCFGVQVAVCTSHRESALT